jgi:hypothetical protein
MFKLKCLSLIALAALWLSACTRAEDPTATIAPTDAPMAVAQATATDRPTQLPTTATNAPAATADRPDPTATQPPAATETPAGPDLSFLEIRADDWTQGPPGAAVTIIEYSDFQ